MVEKDAHSPDRNGSGEAGTPQGITRHISTFTSIAFALACVGLATSGTLPYSTFLGIWPGTNLVVVLVIGVLLSLVHGYTFSMMGVIAPRSGADYVLASRVLGAPVGFVSSWGTMIVGALLAGTALAFISDSLLPSLIRNIGMIVDSPGMYVTAESLENPETVVLVGSVIAVAVFGVCILPPKIMEIITKIGLAGGVISWGLILGQLAFPAFSFSAGWDQFMGSQSYAERFVQATNLGMEIQPMQNWLVYGGLLIGFSLFFGNWIATYYAGEVKNPERTLLASSWTSTIVAGTLFIAGAALIQRFVPVNWLAAESYLYQSEAFSGLTMPWIYFYANVVSPSVFISGLIFFGFSLLLINLVQMQFFYTSRILLAWTEDRMAPSVVGMVHPNLKTPLIALLIVAIISMFSLLASGMMGATNNPIEYILLLAVFQLPPTLAVTVLPFTRPSWFAAAPNIARLKLGSLPMITLTGLISFVYLLAVLVLPFVVPLGKGVGELAIILLVAIIASGVAWFILYRRQQVRSGVRVDEYFRSLSR